MKSKKLSNKLNPAVKILTFFIVVFHLSCKKLVEVDPPVASITSESAFNSDATAIAVLTGVYTNLSSNDYGFVTGLNSISVRSALSADELTLFAGAGTQNLELARFYTNSLISTDDDRPWSHLYGCILPLNTALEKLQNANNLTPAIRKHLLGEASFLRAFCYFYLVNLYGDVPLALQSDYRVNANLPRMSKTTVYQQIVSDLRVAEENLSEKFLDASLLTETQERVRVSKGTATAMLARVYLFNKDWTNAEAQATVLINNSSVFELSTLGNAFLKAESGNKEAIWQLPPVRSGWNTEDAQVFILDREPNSTNKPVYLSTFLISAFDSADLRKTEWVQDTAFNGVDYSYAAKYKIATSGLPVTEYLMVLRLAEQYLIRAEARAMKNDLNGAVSDLNVIRNRAGLSNYSGPLEQSSVLNAILDERQVELFTEWGHRWLDLKRTDMVNNVMSIVTPQKGGTWSPNWAYYPIPIIDIQRNKNIVQNPGY